MSILNSPNSYGSTANSRMLFGRTLNQTQYNWVPSSQNHHAKNSVNDQKDEMDNFNNNTSNLDKL